MPRGYLKHNRAIGAKRSRGGGSRRRSLGAPYYSTAAHWKDKVSYIPDEDLYDYDLEAIEEDENVLSEPDHEEEEAASQYESLGSVFSLLDFVVVHEDECTTASWDVVTFSCDESTSTDVVEDFVDVLGELEIQTDDARVQNCYRRSECCICLEEREVTKLMKRCKHPSACYECLRKTYVTEAQENISSYPLKCFYPSCGRLLHDEQVKGLVQSQDELDRYYRLSVMGRALAGHGTVAHCPNCDHPRGIRPASQTNCYLCRKCHSKYLVVLRFPALEMNVCRFLEKECGPYGWARCAQCNMIICKEGGCDQMICFCGHSFSWTDALRQKELLLNMPAYTGVVSTRVHLMDPSPRLVVSIPIHR